jgi:hypothetical protein
VKDIGMISKVAVSAITLGDTLAKKKCENYKVLYNCKNE